MSDPAETGCDPERCRSPFGAHAVTCRAMLVDEEGRSLAGRWQQAVEGQGPPEEPYADDEAPGRPAQDLPGLDDLDRMRLHELRDVCRRLGNPVKGWAMNRPVLLKALRAALAEAVPSDKERP